MTTPRTKSHPSSGRRLTIDRDTLNDLRSHGSAIQIEGVIGTARDIVAQGGTFSVLPDPEVGGDEQHFRIRSSLKNLSPRSIWAAA